MPKKSVISIIATGVLVLTVYFLKPLTGFDLVLYDFNFFLRSPEKPDERVVIVEWDESSIKILDEDTMSDEVLVSLLTKLGDKPRIVGLDLFRDVPVFSPRLSGQDNLKAYNKLQDIFQTADNLVGIKKVIEPTIAPPLKLEQRGLVAASDIPAERDNFIRRSYLYPQQDEEAKPAGVPYLGVVLGYKYLEQEGWNAESGDRFSLVIAKEEKSIEIEPVSSFVGIPRSDPHGFSFLINWRKAKFKKVSVLDVIFDRYDSGLFKDKIVLIGNTSTSTADKHYLPLQRWSESPLSYGVEIPAQVASSIVAAAINDRTLLSSSGSLLNLGFTLIITAITVLVLSRYCSTSQFASMASVYFKSFSFVAILTSALVASNLALFKLGYWIPVSNSIFVTWVVSCCIAYRYYFKKSKENEVQLDLFVKDINHSLGTPLSKMRSSLKIVQTFCQRLEQQYEDNYQIVDNLNFIKRKSSNIQNNLDRIESYRNRLRTFIDKTTPSVRVICLNRFVEEFARNFVQKSNLNYELDLIVDLDDRINDIDVKIDSMTLATVLQNLIENALYAIKERQGPQLVINTRLGKNAKTVEFAVIDNGPGIPKEYQQEIFKQFRSGRNSSGLGLYICNKLLDVYDSKLSLSSNSSGSKFSFFLPIQLLK